MKEQQDIDKCMKCQRFEANIGNSQNQRFGTYCGIYSRPKGSCDFIPEKEKK